MRGKWWVAAEVHARGFGGHRTASEGDWVRPVAKRALLALATLGSLLVLCASAGAAVTHPYLGSFGPTGAASEFGRPGAVAVDQSSGDVYVADTAAGAVYKFGPEGEPVDFGATGSNKIEGLALSSAEPGLVEIAVNSSTHDFYVVENAPVNGVSVFHANGEEAEFSGIGSHTLTGFAELCGVAVDSEGDVYAADYEGGVNVYEPSGSLLTSAAVSHVCAIAVGPAGALYANQFGGPVARLTPNEFPVTATTTYGDETVVDANAVVGVATDPSNGDLYADEGDAIAQYDEGGNLQGLSGSPEESGLNESEGVAVVGSSGRLFAAAPNPGSGGPEQVARFGAAEAEKPRAARVWVSSVGDSEATLNAEVEPRGQSASLHFEYGEGVCSLGGCDQTTPEEPLGAGTGPLVVSQQLVGLSPLRTYHYRAVFTTAAGSLPATEGSFRTYAAAASGGTDLPDGRSYELVTPGVNNGAQFGVPGGATNLVNGYPVPQRSAANGDSFAATSFTAFGEAVGAPPASTYLSRHTDSGWSLQNITPRDESPRLAAPVRAFSPGLETAWVVAKSVLAPGAVPGFENLYRRDDSTGAYEALTTSMPAVAEPADFCINYAGSSEDGSHVIFWASGGLTPGAVETGSLYEWSAADGIQLASQLPGDVPAAANQLGFGAGGESCFGATDQLARHVISADGSRLFWSEATIERATYARISGTRTIQLDRNQGGAGPSGGGTFLAASADGSRAFFSDPRSLLPGSGSTSSLNGGDLYEYDLDDEELTDLTPAPGSEPAEVLGLVGASEDGSYLYFAAEAALTDGAIAGAANLYLEHEGELRLIATLSRNQDGFDWNSNTVQTAAVSPDGLHLAFVSVERLTKYDNRLATGPACSDSSPGQKCAEVYLYDLEDERLSCASCNPSGGSPIGPVAPSNGSKSSQLNSFPYWTTPIEQPRYLSQDGARLLFVSEEELLPADKNEVQDVYEFERAGAGGDDGCSTGSPTYLPDSEGCLFLISSGRSSNPSYLLEASSNGDDVFIGTNQALSSEDGDQGYDVYDARVGGRVAPPAANVAAPCSGEACRGPAPPPPPAGAIGTTGAVGGGNVKTQCGKGKVRRGGRCQAKHKHAGHKKQGHKKQGHGKKRGGK